MRVYVEDCNTIDIMAIDIDIDVETEEHTVPTEEASSSRVSNTTIKQNIPYALKISKPSMERNHKVERTSMKIKSRT